MPADGVPAGHPAGRGAEERQHLKKKKPGAILLRSGLHIVPAGIKSTSGQAALHLAAHAKADEADDHRTWHGDRRQKGPDASMRAS